MYVWFLYVEGMIVWVGGMQTHPRTPSLITHSHRQGKLWPSLCGGLPQQSGPQAPHIWNTSST